jgi:hypothetical protein
LIEDLYVAMAALLASNLRGPDNGIMNINSEPLLAGACGVTLSVDQPLLGVHRQ